MAAQSQTDPMITWLVLVLMMVAGTYGMWLVTYRVTGPAIMMVKQAELYPLTFVSRDAANSYRQISGYRVQASREFATGGDHKQMWRFVSLASMKSGQHYRWPAMLFLGILGFYVLFFKQQYPFKNKHSLESLLAVQAKSWPVITPFIKFNPATGPQRAPGARVPLELPLFSEALYPEEWMAFNRIRVVNGVPDRDQIRRALLPQLGERFEGFDQLPEHLYCLLAGIALKGAQKRTQSDDFLGLVASCWSSEAGFKATAAVKSQAAKILNDKKIAGPLLDIMGKHAYTATAFIAALGWARRQGGVLAPAQFVWLRGEDRELWYPLNNLGRRAFHVEAAGAMAHYQAEVEARRPLIMPRLDAAVVSIVQYLSETRARIPEIEGSVERKAEPQVGRADTLKLSNQKKR